MTNFQDELEALIMTHFGAGNVSRFSLIVMLPRKDQYSREPTVHFSNSNTSGRSVNVDGDLTPEQLRTLGYLA